jgi:hypothetical protein
MFGKIFESLYRGSMVGAGSHVFAVWGYVIANMKPDRAVGFQVELNARLLAPTIGDTEDRMQKAIDFLCSPDENSRTPDEDGRRLKRLGKFDFQVVNGEKYRQIRDEEQRRQQNRDAQKRRRLKISKSSPSAGESEYVAAVNRGAGEDELNDIITKHLPKKVVESK